MKLKPVLTEKSMQDAREGKYTFITIPSATKYKVKHVVEQVFGVKVARVRTISQHGRKKKTLQGKIKTIMPAKKAIVTLKGKDKIDIFEESKS